MSSSFQIWTLPRFSSRLQDMSSNAERLAEAVKARREELEVSQFEVSQNGGPSNTWLTLIENGRLESLSRVIARKLDKGLKWAEGSARTVWDGDGEATPAAEGLSGEDVLWLADMIEKANLSPEKRRRMLAELARDERGA